MNNTTVNRTRKLTDDQKKQIAEKLMDGKSAISIAREFSISDKTVLYYAKKYNINTKHKKAEKKPVARIGKTNKVTDIDEFVSLYNSGLSYEELANKYDMSTANIYHCIKRAEKLGKIINKRKADKRDRRYIMNDAAVDVILLWCNHETYTTISQRTNIPQNSVKRIIERFLEFKKEVIDSESLPPSYSPEKLNQITLMYLNGQPIIDILHALKISEALLNIYLDKLDAFFRHKAKSSEIAEDKAIDKCSGNSDQVSVIELEGGRLEIQNCPKDLIDILKKISDGTVNLSDINDISDILSSNSCSVYSMTKEVR